MSSWGCQSGSWTGTPECVSAAGSKFEWPVTLHIYSVGTANAVGTQVAQLTKTFKMPYRPSQNNVKCTGGSKGAWYKASTKECFHGKFFKITFVLKGVSLPPKAIISVSYDTSDYGVAQRPKACNGPPDNCPYDSLNVGLTEPANEAKPEPVKPSVGEDPAPEAAYHNSTTAANYCDSGLQGTGTFRLDSGVPPCWTGYQPLFLVTTQ